MAGKNDSVSVRVPYRNLKDTEVEMTGMDDEAHHRIDLNSTAPSPSSSKQSGGGGDLSPPQSMPVPNQNTLMTLILSCTVAAGVQFGWALQLSLLTPYIQTLGIGHAFSSFIWLCGPITGLVVQPCVGIWSDKCSLKMGRRRPFILAGSLMISVSVVLIGFSADIGYLLGDTHEHCRTFKGTRTRAAFVFIIGFWLLDLANNTVQGPARALLADLSGPDQRNTANAVFCSWMAVGNILGFSAGASGNWHRLSTVSNSTSVNTVCYSTYIGFVYPTISFCTGWFPFLLSRSCCEACGNLKAAFLLAVVFLLFCTLVTIHFAKEVPLIAYQPMRVSDSAPLLEEHSKSLSDRPVIDNANQSRAVNGYERDKNVRLPIPNVEEVQNGGFQDGPGAVLVNLLTSLRHLPPAMHSVLIVMALTWLSWFPFFLFDTDWMGREVYHGDPSGNLSEVHTYDQGVRQGAFGLLLNSVVLGVSSFLIEPMCKRMGSRLVWAMSNFIVFACMAGTAIISWISVGEYSKGIEHVIGGNDSIKIASLIVFALLGFPLAITYSVPFSVTAELTADAGGGQGLAIGVLNLAIVVPQMIVSLGAGPWDALFGGGNIPAFVLASFAALAAGIFALRRLPDLSNSFTSTGFHFG